MYIKLYPYLFFLSALFLQGVSFAQYNTEVEAKIQRTLDVEYIELNARATNLLQYAKPIKYVFTTFKKDSLQNQSNNEQNGTIVLEQNQSVILSKLSVTDDGSEIIALLLIYDDDNNLIGKDRWLLNEAGEIKTTVIKKEDFDAGEIEPGIFKGITVEDTKTKAGRDFYKIFYSKYYLSQLNLPELISITETFALGRNTKIEVKLDTDLVAQFFVRPSNDFLKEMADEVMIRINRYKAFQKAQKEQLNGN